MNRFIMTAGLILSFACQPFASDHRALARVTVYWPSEGSGRSAAWNDAQLRENHCAVDPKKIPYGSNVIFEDAKCIAVDSGPDVIKRKAARSSGHTPAERNAVVIDRFFNTKQRALAWASSHPHFMIVRVQTADTKPAAN